MGSAALDKHDFLLPTLDEVQSSEGSLFPSMVLPMQLTMEGKVRGVKRRLRVTTPNESTKDGEGVKRRLAALVHCMGKDVSPPLSEFRDTGAFVCTETPGEGTKDCQLRRSERLRLNRVFEGE